MGKWNNTIYSLLLTYLVFDLFETKGLLIFFSIIGLFWYFQDRFIYLVKIPQFIHTPRDSPDGVKDPKEVNLDVIDVEISTEDKVKLKGWLAKSPYSKRIIVYFHGNLVQLWWRIGMIKCLKSKTDSDVLIVAYRGYSQNQGKPSEEGLKTDARSVMEFAEQLRNKEKKEGRLKQLYIYGRSLGGAVGIYLAASTRFRYEIKGLILENTFSELVELFQDKLTYIFPFLVLLMKRQWKSKQIISQIEVPILFIRSLKDKVVHPHHMEELMALATKTRLKMDYKVAEGKHSPVWYQNSKAYVEKINQFFQLAQQKEMVTVDMTKGILF